jgi:hypothetical protein
VYKRQGLYNEDTDICLRMLKDGYCTLNFNAFSGDKDATMVTKGGNTSEVYGETNKRDEFVDSLIEQHPDVVKKVWRYERWHHEVNYNSFKKNRLILREGIKISDKINNYGMKLIEAT